MYVRPSQRPRDEADVLELLRRHAFATLVSRAESGMMATHLPFLYEEGTLFAHMARANPHSDVLEDDAESLVVFLGPHGYISPSWYADRATAPTWDYIAVHCYGRARVHDGDEARRNIERLVAAMESGRPDPWSFADLPAGEAEVLLRNVVSFEIPLSRIEPKFKLNQGEKPERTRAAVAALERDGLHELAAAIRRYNFET